MDSLPWRPRSTTASNHQALRFRSTTQAALAAWKTRKKLPSPTSTGVAELGSIGSANIQKLPQGRLARWAFVSEAILRFVRHSKPMFELQCVFMELAFTMEN